MAKHKKTFGIVFIVLILVLAGVSIGKYIVKHNDDMTGAALVSFETKYELTEDDVFAEDDWISTDVSVLGITLGQRATDVLTILGNPDIRSELPPNIQNYEYGESIGLENNGLIIHLEDGIVTRITINEEFRPLVSGEINELVEKKHVYFKFGAPDNTQFIPFEANSARVFRLLSYYEKGLEFHVQKNDVFGMSFVP